MLSMYDILDNNVQDRVLDYSLNIHTWYVNVFGRLTVVLQTMHLRDPPPIMDGK